MTPPLVKLIVGFLYPDEDLYLWTVRGLSSLWGRIERKSPRYPFDHTDYYRDIAPVLYKAFVSFEGLFPADDIVRWKRQTIALEAESGPRRRVNIDPGYIDGARLALASTKDHAHRLYISDGIFAEITLRFMFGRWVSYDHTFPDFKSGRYDDFLSLVRNDWLSEIRRKRRTTA